jgi:Ca2+-binding RTX toxin-like protein
MRHVEQRFRALQYGYQVVGKQQVNSKSAEPALQVALPTDRISFGKVMYEKLISKRNEADSIPYITRTIEQDGYVFQREAYRILGEDPSAWYPSALNNAVPAVPLVDSNTYNIQLLSGTNVKINNQIIQVSPIPFKPLNKSIGSDRADSLIGDITFVAGQQPIYQPSDDFIQGKGDNDYISGNEGNDFLYGNTGNDSVIGGNGDDFLYGEEGNDILNGENGDDALNGGTGNDILNGGSGDDSYYIDSINDSIQGEISTGGNDSVHTSISLNLGSYLENIILIGDGNITAAGNNLNNRLVGNTAVNILNGLAGDDVIYGLTGNDTLKGGDGNDYLDGDNQPGIIDGDGLFFLPQPIENDFMEGGSGNDTYVVNVIGDVVLENALAGNDTVISSISYNLGANLENLTLVGSGNITGAGNTLDNILTGNDKVNLLNGLAGNDTIYGGGGNDTLTGSTGDDILVGEAGNDSLIGGIGFDRFSFGTPGQAFTTATSGFDTIADFQAGTDKIQLQRSSFTALTTLAGSALKASEFAIVTTDAAAATSAGLIVYNQTNDKLFYNANGTAVGFGNGGEFALVSNIATLAASNIAVV